MELKASVEKKTFFFKRPSGTSRGILTEKYAWFITVWDINRPTVKGVGECSIIEGLSPDFTTENEYNSKILEVVKNINHFSKRIDQLVDFPSIYFGLEMALLDLINGGKRIFFDTPFTQGEANIPINGLVWMGELSFMQSQIQQKIKEGFDCIKIKIGALHFEKEFNLIQSIRKDYPAEKLSIRVDANGAFNTKEALKKLHELSLLGIHSIEQPIAVNQWKEMYELCQNTPIPIALDEELIGHNTIESKEKLLVKIQPQYIILKPSLIGGFKGTTEWIKLADDLEVPWWITSALESNIGLDAIAQFTSTYNNSLHQGLGTGALYTNNFPSPLFIENGFIGRRKT